MRLLSWNTNFRSAECLEGILALQPDVVLLQEVRHATAPTLVAALRDLECIHVYYSGSASDERKRYGNIIASRWPVSPARRDWAAGMPWPQLASRATVRAPSGDIDTINVHIPNGSGNGWRKVESLEALASALESSDDGPRVLAGDFNEPQAILRNGDVVTFGQRIAADGSVRLGRLGSSGARAEWFTDKNGQEDNLQRWDAAVRRIFDTAARHGLRHVNELGDGRPPPTTHIVRGRPRFFDHLFLSRHFRTKDYRYLDSVRENLKYSDHSALYADVVMDGGTA